MTQRAIPRSLEPIRWTVRPFILLVFWAPISLAQDIDYVIQISVDGLHSGQLQNLLLTDPDRYSNFQRFVSEGATTFNARTDFSNNVTLPNHTSMISGRPVRQPADDPTVHHGYLNNGLPLPTDTLHLANPAVPYIASTFDRAHDRGLSTALYTGKEKFVIYERSYNVTETTQGGRPDQYLDDGDQGVNKIDKYEFEVIKGTSSGIMATLLEDFQANPFHYTFLHFLEPDSAGHAYGWRSEQWNDVVHSVDQQLGQLFQLIESQSQLAGRTAMILTTDHGGELFTHGATNQINLFRIPFLVWGPGVAPGTDLYELNTLTRVDPGQVQIAYTEPLQPIRNGDSGNLAMSLLGLAPIEGSSINARQDLRVDLPKIASWDGASNPTGQAGDGLSWNDARNWQRAGHQDFRPIAGDVIVLPASAQPTLIDLDGAQQVQSLGADGDYQLYNGELQLVSGELTVAENRHLGVTGSVSSPFGIIKQGLGTLAVDLIATSNLLISAGRVEGPVVVEGDVGNRAVLAPGDANTVQHIQGSLTQAAAGIVSLELASDGASGELIVDGTAILRGILDVKTVDAAVDPGEPGEFVRWTLVTMGRRIGSFQSVDYNGVRLAFDQTTPALASLHDGDGLFRRLEYTDTSVTWVNYRAMAGDANGDGAFNSADLVSVFATGGYENGVPFDAGWTTGDWNGDSDFTSNDLVEAFATAQFEQPSILLAGRAVPEPGAFAYGLVVCAALFRRISRPNARNCAALAECN